MASIKMRAATADGVTTIKALISHPMDTGLVKDKKNRQDDSGSFHPGSRLQAQGHDRYDRQLGSCNLQEPLPVIQVYRCRRRRHSEP